MKKYLLIATSMLLTSICSWAQTSSEEKVQPRNKVELSFGAGVMAMMRVVDNSMCNEQSWGWSGCESPSILHPVLMLEAQFSKSSSIELNLSYDVNHKLIEVPLMYKFNSRILQIAIGPEVGIPARIQKIMPSVEGGVPPYTYYCNYTLGLMAKVEKDILIGRYTKLTPYIIVNPTALMVNETPGYPARADFVMDMAAGFTFKWRL